MRKKMISASILCILILTNAFSQTEKFDIATFIPPMGWQRVDSNGTVAFLDSKTINGLTSFCQIILYPSRSSAGNADKNFKTAWQNLVAIPTKSEAKPATQTEKTPDGWTVITGAANITYQGMNYNSILATVTGFGKTMNVQVNLAGNDYAAIIEKFFNDLNLDSMATVTASQQNNNSNRNQTIMTGTITMNDYDFIAPPDWQVQKNKDEIRIQNMKSGCLIQILAPQPSSGDLEQEAKAVFDMMYKGWQYQKTGKDKYVLSKGFLPKGLEYCMIEAPMSKLSSDGSRYEGFEEGAGLVIRNGNQTVIIAVRHNSSLLDHDDCRNKYETWRRFFNSFTVKNAIVPKNNEEDVSNRIMGAWSQTESGASSEYVFAANGNYALVGAIGSKYTSSDYRYEYLHIRTYAFEGDGNYAVSGNQLTLKKRSDNNPEQVRFRFEKVNRGGTGWKDRICMLKKNATDGKEYEVCYEKQDLKEK